MITVEGELVCVATSTSDGLVMLIPPGAGAGAGGLPRAVDGEFRRVSSLLSADTATESATTATATTRMVKESLTMVWR